MPLSPDATPGELPVFRQNALAFLTTHGYGSPALSDTGHIIFLADGLTFCLLLDEDDPEYVRICLPNFYQCDAHQDASLAASVASKCQPRFKLGEYVLAESWVSAQVPLLMDTPDFLTQDRMFRLTQLLRTMAQDFVETLRAAQAVART